MPIQYPSLSITAIVLTKNEETMIMNCLETLSWCDEVIVLDDTSTDATVHLAETWGARIIGISADSFSKKRSAALKYVKTDWVLFVDADERVTPALYAEIATAVQSEKSTHAWQFMRKNVCYGHELAYGGWQFDTVTRLFHCSALKGWVGSIHESPQFSGTRGTFHNPLWHLTHRSTKLNLLKSAEWTPMEAKLLYDANSPPVTFFTLLRKGGMEFWRRVIRQQGYKDGMVGYVEGFVQALNRVMVYIQVWELQQKPKIPDRYAQLETSIAHEWKQKL